jgi:hypothetical protein
MRTRVTLAAALVAAALGTGAVAAQSGPPFPDFFWPYGTVQIGGENVTPPTQLVVALVNGRACGQTETKLAEAIPANPPADVGKTVFALTVHAGGDGPGQVEGCGRLGDRVIFWLPRTGAFASQQPFFAPGPLRVDLTLLTPLAHRVAVPLVSGGVE